MEDKGGSEESDVRVHLLLQPLVHLQFLGNGHVLHYVVKADHVPGRHAVSAGEGRIKWV